MKRKLLQIWTKIKKNILSMRMLIVVLVLASAMLPLGVARAVVVDCYKDRAIDNLIIEAKSRVNLLAGDISRTDYFSTQRNENITAQIEQITFNYSGRIVLVASNYVVIKDTYVVQENKTLISAEVNRAFEGNITTNYVEEDGYIEMAVPVYTTDGKNVMGVIILTCSDSGIINNAQYISQIFNVIYEIAFVLFVIFAFASAWFVNRPFKRLTKVIKGITSGYMDKRVDEDKSFSEIQDMAAEVNKMLERLKTLDESRQEFVSNVSHELKTPITSIKVLADSLNNQEEVPVEIYKDFMHDIADEIDRESEIINDLLALVRMDKTAAELNIAPYNINELVEHVLKRLKPIAEEKNIELVLESFRPVVAEVDDVKMSLVITNLVENAIKYNVANGWVRVSVNADHKYFYLTVSDSGIGIPDDSREKIFERFYRVDKARSRQTGGTGLGLAITRNAILMHKGAIKVYSKEGEGSTFTVRIPLTYTK